MTQPEDLRPNGVSYVVTAGQTWWVQIVVDKTDLTGQRDRITAEPWQSWSTRAPVDDAVIGIRATDEDLAAGIFYVGQDVATRSCVFYVQAPTGPTADAPLATVLGVVIDVKGAGVRQ